MPIELTHIGEELVAAIMESLAQRSELDRVVCGISGRTLAQDIATCGLGEALRFRADHASLVVRTGEVDYSCDGEQKVDVLCAGDTLAIAFEAKLGTERMGAAEFRRQFCTPCEKSKHADDRISGSMVAVLERSLPFEVAVDLVAGIGDSRWQVVPGWWLVLRQRILDRWRKAGNCPVTTARIVSFESLARLYGSRQQFDNLVQRVVGFDFAGRWGIPFHEPK